MNRPICNTCKSRPRAISYTRQNGKIQYRSICEHCLKLKKTGRLSKSKPIYEKNGYKKKTHCDLCGFKARYKSQLIVYYVDGNLGNNSMINLRTICLNCAEVVKRTQTTWKLGDLEVD